MNLNKANLAVGAAASVDPTRPNINSIHITDKFTEATNGHILARVDLPFQFDPLDVPASCPTEKAETIQPFTIPAKAVASIKMLRYRSLPICNEELFVDVEKTNSGETAYFNATDTISTISPKIEKINNDYPDTDRVVNINDEVKFHTCLNIGYLQTLLSIAKTAGCSHVTIDGYEAKNKPVVFKSIDGQGFFGLIMPYGED